MLGSRGAFGVLKKCEETSKENWWTTWVAVLLVLIIVKFVGVVS
jgi:hypothetical protein